MLEFNENTLMFSDALSQHKLVLNDNITLLLNVQTVAESQILYNALKEGGEIILELQKIFFSKSYAQIKEKFGITWQINATEI